MMGWKIDHQSVVKDGGMGGILEANGRGLLDGVIPEYHIWLWNVRVRGDKGYDGMGVCCGDGIEEGAGME